jgi:catechol 2,3-dioxygenase-like lactoylglutathione lyase family enzyme
VINGAHLILFTTDAEATRSFLADALGFRSVDAGEGWLIFALPPAELAVHPAEESRHELYLMCDDLEATMVDLAQKGAAFDDPVEAGWGRIATMTMPGGARLGVYEPRHARP